MSDQPKPRLARGEMADLVRSTGLTKTTIWRAISGIQCAPETAVTIHRASGGKVPCWFLRPDLWAKGQLPPGLAGHQPCPAGEDLAEGA